MATKKKAKQKKLVKWTVLLAFLAGTGLLTVLLYLTYYTLKANKVFLKTPVYEEIYNTRESLKASIRRIDHTIFEVFYIHRIPDRDIIFLTVGPRQKGGQVWEFTEMAVRCPDLATCAKIEKDLLGRFDMDHPGHIRICQKDMRQIVFKIWVNGFMTHQVSLLVSKEHVPRLGEKPRVALIIDDLGYDLKIAREFFDCGIPLSFSVLPFAPYSRKIAKEALSHGFEVLLHLPMEPRNYPNVRPGPGAILLNMNDEDIVRTIEEDISQVPGICGVNNHMGSLFTEESGKMKLVLEYLARQGLFYVDSRTTSASVGYELASELGIPCAERDIFIDNDLHSESIRMQIKRLMKIARRTGRCIGIAHPHRETLDGIRALLEMDTGVEFVPVSRMVQGLNKRTDNFNHGHKNIYQLPQAADTEVRR